MLIGRGESFASPFNNGVHLKDPFCCKTGLIVFVSVAFELWKDLKPVEIFGLWSSESSFLDRKFDAELDGKRTLLEGSSLLLDSNESPGLKLHFENSCNCESLLDTFL